jgi:hypothetical protein
LWSGSLVLDEADFANTNEKSELIHFLNCRATGTPISRQDAKNPRKTDVFANFGITILTQRRAFDDNATESRCLPYYSEKTDKKLPTVETDEMLEEGLELQNMLFYLRLKFYQSVTIDKEAWINEIVDPRLVSSLLPLLALSKFEPDIRTAISTVVKDIAKLKVEQKSNSEDGTLLNSLWEKGLFAVYSGIPNNEHYYFQRKEFGDDGKSVSVIPLTVSALAEEFKSTSRNIRKALTSLNLCAAGMPKLIKVGNKPYRVIFFDPLRFEKRLREFVIDYKPYELYEKLGLEKPKKVTQVTEVTDKTHDAKQLSFLENELHVGTVTSVTSVTKEQRECGQPSVPSDASEEQKGDESDGSDAIVTSSLGSFKEKLEEVKTWLVESKDANSQVDSEALAKKCVELGLDVQKTVKVLLGEYQIFEVPTMGKWGVK